MPLLTGKLIFYIDVVFWRRLLWSSRTPNANSIPFDATYGIFELWFRVWHIKTCYFIRGLLCVHHKWKEENWTNGKVESARMRLLLQRFPRWKQEDGYTSRTYSTPRIVSRSRKSVAQLCFMYICLQANMVKARSSLTISLLSSTNCSCRQFVFSWLKLSLSYWALLRSTFMLGNITL